MYRIIGADGKEYGPATADQVREWIAEGRANTQTRIQIEGSPGWRPMSELPEFEAALAAQRLPGAPFPPKTAATEAEALAAQIIARDYHVDIGDCIARSWSLVTGNFWPVVGTSLLVILIQAALGAVPFLGAIAGLLLGGVFAGGLYFFFLKLVRQQAADLNDAFVGFRLAFVPLMLAGLVKTLLTVAGVVLCILPGIYLAVAWMFTYLLVVDKGLDFWPAMELSRKVVTKHWWTLLGLVLINLLIALAGVLACVVGVLVAIPVGLGAVVYAYEDIFGSKSSPAP